MHNGTALPTDGQPLQVCDYCEQPIRSVTRRPEGRWHGWSVCGKYCSRACREFARRDRRTALSRRVVTDRDDDRPDCPVCGTGMVGRRSGAIYCGPRCRVAAHRGGSNNRKDTTA